MTDRINSFIVVLDKDIRDDCVDPITNAIRMIKGVLSMTPRVTNDSDYVAQTRVRNNLID